MAGLMERVKKQGAPAAKPVEMPSYMEEAIWLPISQLKLHPVYGRDSYDDEHQAELNESVAQRGIQQPLIARFITDSMTRKLHPELTHELVAGYRRRYAATVNGMLTVPLLERDIDNLEAAAISLTENLQRQKPPLMVVGRQLLNLRSEMESALAKWESRAIELALDGKRPKKLEASHLERMASAVSVPPFLDEILERAKTVRRNPKINWEHVGAILSLPERSLYEYIAAVGLAPEVQKSAEVGDLGREHIVVVSGIKDHAQQKHLSQAIVAKNLTVKQAKELAKNYRARSIGNAAVAADPFNPKKPLKAAIDFLAEAARNVQKSDLKPIERANDVRELKSLIVSAKEQIAVIERALATGTC